MTKKRIRYSEMTPPPPPPPARATPAVAGMPVPVPVAAAPAPAPSPVLESVRAIAGRLTPARANLAISRPTPVRGGIAIPRLATTVGPVAAPAPVAVPAGPPTLRERARTRSGKVELLVFAIANEWFGVELAAVEEAIDLPTVRHIPEMPPAMLGVITVRETLTSLFTPTSALGLTLGGGASALIFRRGRGRVGIAVDDLDDVHTLDLAQLRDAPGVDAREGVLLGVLRYRDTLLALVDAEALITACQIVPLMETA